MIKRILQELHKFGIPNPQICELPISDLSLTAIAIKIDHSNRYELWKHFRNIKDEIGFYPVVTASCGDDKGSWEACVKEEDFFMRAPFTSNQSGLDVDPLSIIERSTTVDVSKVLEAHNRVYSEDLVDYVPSSIDDIRHEFDKAPTEQDVLTAMASGQAQDYFQLQRWLFDWQLQNVGIESMKKQDSSFLDWYEPQEQAEVLMLLPTINGYEALAYIHWYGAESVSSESAIAMLRKWNKEYGAELVAHYGTMLHLTADHIPSDPHQAFNLAMEQEALAPSTTALPGATLSNLATALLTKNNWFLHEKP